MAAIMSRGDELKPMGTYEDFGTRSKYPGGRINIKMPSYQYMKSHCGDKTILWPSYLHNGISYTDTMTSLYWIRAQDMYKQSYHTVFWISYPCHCFWYQSPHTSNKTHRTPFQWILSLEFKRPFRYPITSLFITSHKDTYITRVFQTLWRQ